MKQRHFGLLALLSFLTLMSIASFAVAEEKAFGGQMEIGVSGVDVKDNPARVNEYVNGKSTDGLSFAPKLSLESEIGENSEFALEADVAGPRDQQFNLELDANRILQLDVDYQVMEHWKDHETLDQMGATARDDVDRSQPNVTTDKIMADLQDAGLDINTFTPTNDPDGGVGGGTLGYDPRAAYEQELANDYLVTRRELKSEANLTIPALANVTFHAGMRVETRDGLEQAIGLTKCDSCHVTATGKNINERTEDLTLGATGKFGLVTIDYEYLNRSFDEDSSAPMRYYEDATNPNSSQLLYESGTDYPFASTPDSEKESHSLKARVDLPKDTSITASYVKSDVESSKSQTQDEYELMGGNTLKSEFESFGAKLSTKLSQNLRLSLRGSTYEIDADGNEIYYPQRDAAINASGAAAWPGSDTDDYLSAEARDVDEIGLDLVYRLAKATTLRLGYEYETVEREEEELGETETHTLKAAFKTRINKALSGRASYQYQNIDEPFTGAHVGIAQGDGLQDPLGSGLWYYSTADFTAPAAPGSVPTWYWTAVYPNRQLESTSQPEDVHEAKLSGTWSARPNLAATLFARVRYEENNQVSYEQTTYVPGASLWYAPSGKVNLTMAYTFNKQETENQMCVGWYHG